MTSNACEVKVVLLGDTGVGKSSLVLRFVTKTFRSTSESTIGASFMSKLIVVDGIAVKYQIWDTAGQEKYHGISPMYYRGAGAAIMESFAKSKKYAEQIGALFFETSAKENTNVTQAFEDISRKLRPDLRSDLLIDPNDIRLGRFTGNGTKRCCC
eukprot:GSMAST32.ASY1.ANO1.699.1 assembled CDS